MNENMDRIRPDKLLIISITLFSLIPFICLPSSGHDILLTTFNIFLWMTCSLTILFSSIIVFKKGYIKLPKNIAYILLFPFFIVISNFLNGSILSLDSFIRTITIVAPIFFVISLMQLCESRRALDNAIYILIFGLLLTSIVAIVQTIPGRILDGIIPHYKYPRAMGVWMQPNLLASAVCTGVLLSVIQIASPGFKTRPNILKYIVLANIALGAYVIIASGSRTGIISFLITTPVLALILLSRMRRNKAFITFFFLPIAIGILSSTLLSGGTQIAYSKLERLADTSADIRTHIYKISFSMIIEEPIYGLGSGNFSGRFHDASADYIEEFETPPFAYASHFSHPHNDLLMLLIENGILGLIGLILAIYFIMSAALRLGKKNAAVLLILLTPILIHSQTELPLFSSVFHILILSFIIFMIVNHRNNHTVYKLKNKTSVLLSGFIIFAISSFSLIKTFEANRNLMGFLYYFNPDPYPLSLAEKNTYFHDLAKTLRLKVLLAQDIEKNTFLFTEEYIEWAEKFIIETPETSTFHDLAIAYAHLGKHDKSKKIIEQGLRLYPGQPDIQSAQEKIDNIIIPRQKNQNSPNTN